MLCASYDNAAKDTSPNDHDSVQISVTSSLLNSQICASNDFGITLQKKTEVTILFNRPTFSSLKGPNLLE